MLTKNELLKITGGDAFSIGTLLGGLLSFIIGIVDGYFNPSGCNE